MAGLGDADLSDSYYMVVDDGSADNIAALLKLRKDQCVRLCLSYDYNSGKRKLNSMSVDEIEDVRRGNNADIKSLVIKVGPEWKISMQSHKNWSSYSYDVFFSFGASTYKVGLNRTDVVAEEDGGVFYASACGQRTALDMSSNGSAEQLHGLLYSAGVKFADLDQKNRFLTAAVRANDAADSLKNLTSSKKDGISRTLERVKGMYARLVDSGDIMSALAVCFLVKDAQRTVSAVKMSVLFNSLFAEADDESFAATSKEMSRVLETNSYGYLDRLLDTLPVGRDIKKAALKRRSTGAVNRIMDDLDFVKIDADAYPLTHEAVFSGELPLGTFFRKSGDSYFMYNDNWALWEGMLSAHPSVAKEIAAEASRRTTYEKDLCSYFYFVLHGLPEYLERHTGRKWTCVPKLVVSANELEPPSESDGGTVKKRSALTPTADNESCVVTVPYVSMAVAGQQTTYCYGHSYCLLERGLSYKGNTVMKDLEERLNGRDDYGLMFYTLTGTAAGRGYPTFLIIFERLEGGTRVHFHRTHPMRSKDGEYNPVHNWTVGCYNWMVGNVSMDRVQAQQGDLVFVSAAGELPDGDYSEVNSFDSHRFERPVSFTPYAKKERSNVLGYFRIDEPVRLTHAEHMTRLIPAGNYELRQCRSWEANPKGIWSLRID